MWIFKYDASHLMTGSEETMPSIPGFTDFGADIFKILVGYGVLVAGLVYLAKTIFKQLLARDIEEHKHQLQKEAAVEIERLRSGP